MESNSNYKSLDSFSAVEQQPVFVKKRFWQQNYFKDKLGINVFLSLSLFYSIAVGVLIPNLFTDYVSYNHPSYDKNQVEVEASRLKSIFDSLPYIANFLLTPGLGWISDRYGRKLSLAIIMVLQIIDLLMIGLGYWKKVIVPVYISHTFGGVINSVSIFCFAYLADLTTVEERGPLFIAVGIAHGLSILIGQFLMIGLMKLSNGITILGAIFFLLLAIFLLIPIVNSIRYKEGRPRTAYEVEELRMKSNSPFKNIKTLFSSSKVVVCYAFIYFSYSFTVQDLIASSFYYTETKFNWGSIQNMLVNSFVGLSVTIWSLIIPLILKKSSDRKLLSLFLFMNFIYRILYAFSVNQYMWGVFITSGAFSVVIPYLISSIISKATPPDIQGIVLSGVSSVSSIASAGGSYTCDNIFAYFISGKAPFFFPGMPFIICGVIIFIFFVYSLIIYKIFSKQENDLQKSTQHETKSLLSDYDDDSALIN